MIWIILCLLERKNGINYELFRFQIITVWNCNPSTLTSFYSPNRNVDSVSIFFHDASSGTGLSFFSIGNDDGSIWMRDCGKTRRWDGWKKGFMDRRFKWRARIPIRHPVLQSRWLYIRFHVWPKISTHRSLLSQWNDVHKLWHWLRVKQNKIFGY